MSTTTIDPMAESRATDYEVEVDLSQTERNYPAVGDYYKANCSRDDIPVTYQPGLSNYSNLNLGDDRIMFKESLMTATFKRPPPGKTDREIRNRRKPAHVRCAEYVDAVRTIGFDEVERMERIIRDKLRQRSMETSSPFQVRKSFKFFDRDKEDALDMYGFINAMEFLGFQFTEMQVCALFARYDTELTGLIDYMYLYQRCMEKNDDVPVVWPPTPHLGVIFKQGEVPEPPKKQNIEANNFEDGEIRHLQAAEIKRIFLMVDKNDKGFIYTDEMELLLLALNMNMVPSEVSKVIEVCDADNTGKIQFTDFFNWWYQDQRSG